MQKSCSDGQTAQEKSSWAVALYIRALGQDETDLSLQVADQKRILAEYMENRFQDHYTITDYYIDGGRLGAGGRRPDFQRMIQDVENGTVRCVICASQSHAFSSDAEQWYFMQSFFPLYHTRFVTLDDPRIDTCLNPDPVSSLIRDRQEYARSVQARRCLDEKRAKGKFVGAFAAYGYMKDPKDKNALIIDEEAAQVVRNIFQWYVYGDETSKQGLSKEYITRKLNDMGIPNPALYKLMRGRKYKNPHAQNNDGLWGAYSVSRILKNKLYIGTTTQGKQRTVSYKIHNTVDVPQEEWIQVEHTHEAIIPLPLFELAQNPCAQNAERPFPSSERHLFSGILKCADCGKAMIRRESKGYVYYTCSTYKRKSRTKCTKHTIRLDALENAVLLVIQKQIELTESLKDALNNIRQAPAVQAKLTRSEYLLKSRGQEIEDLISCLYMDWKNGDVTREQYWEMKKELERQETRLKEISSYIMEEMDAQKRKPSWENDYLEAFLKHKNVRKLSRGLLMELIEAILIHENGAITIRFKLEDPYPLTADHAKVHEHVLETK